MEQDMILDLTPDDKIELEVSENCAIYKVGDGYFMIEEHSEGWNYNFYDRNMIVVDGGVYDDSEISIGDAIAAIIEDEKFIGKESLLDRSATMLDFTAFIAEMYSREQEHTSSQLKDFQFDKSEDVSYAIYQLKNSDYTRRFCFENFAYLADKNIDIEKSNFNNVYTATLDENIQDLPIDAKLNRIYDRFNIDPPEDFTGHSLSVGDVVAFKVDGELSYHFVDSFGFKEIPFEKVPKPLQNIEVQNLLHDLVSIAKSKPYDFMEALAVNQFARNELVTTICVCNLQDELDVKFSFGDLVKLNSFCHDAWLKVDEVSFEKITDFAIRVLNKNIMTLDEILSMKRSEFGIAALENCIEAEYFENVEDVADFEEQF